MRLPQKCSYYSRCYLSIVDGHDASAGLHRDLLLWQVLCAERGQQAAARVPAHRGGQPLIHVHSVIPTLHLHMHSYCTHFKLTKKTFELGTVWYSTYSIKRHSQGVETLISESFSTTAKI